MDQSNGIDTQAIQEAMARRQGGGMGGGQMAQPQMQPQQAPQSPMPAVDAMTGGAIPPESKESSVIVKALIDRLKQYSK